MGETLKIEIEADTKGGLLPLLNHVFREITEGIEYTNHDIEFNSKIRDNWLIVEKGIYRGKYFWYKGE